VVTAVLLAIALPPTLPWWVTLLGVVFAIVIVKQLYGGLGYNPFNPAMAAYVFLLISYPVYMTTWLPPTVLAEHTLSFSDSLHMILTGKPAGGHRPGTRSPPPRRSTMRTALDQNQLIEEIRQSPLWGDFGGAAGSGSATGSCSAGSSCCGA
jgi:Na+-translocating ferredoxin:NAD+ oxidoreductase subunit D